LPERPFLVLVGGFLGAGKTTLILRAARLLHQRGMRAAIITNDQAGSLVDTRLAAAAGIDAGEVAGACFCCRFAGFIAAAENLLPLQPDVIFAEPVGSCADLSATVLQPLKQNYRDKFRLAPYSVLMDPQREGQFTDPLLDYLSEEQLAEADLVLINKSDLQKTQPPATSHQSPVTRRCISALTGQGVAEWLDEVLSGRFAAGAHLLDIDYARYAAAEAALGWLNWEAGMRLEKPLSPASVVGPLLERLDAVLTEAGAAIAHLKIFDRASTGYIRAGICRNGDEPSVEGDLLASPASDHELIVNLRAAALPATLLDAVTSSTAALPGELHVVHQQSFQPLPPVPEHRFTNVVPAMP
jgi:Ni2+-binding GTPase involved in maturation of urease and hydrogenase